MAGFIGRNQLDGGWIDARPAQAALHSAERENRLSGNDDGIFQLTAELDGRLCLGRIAAGGGDPLEIHGVEILEDRTVLEDTLACDSGEVLPEQLLIGMCAVVCLGGGDTGIDAVDQRFRLITIGEHLFCQDLEVSAGKNAAVHGQECSIHVKKYVFGDARDERIIKNIADLAGRSFESYVIDKLAAYKGKSISELKALFQVTSDAKSLGAIIAYKILGVSGNKAAELDNAGVAVKTIRIRNNGTIKESMSFPPFKFQELAKESWEESTFGDTLRDTRFLFIVYRFDENNVLRLMGGQFWNIPFTDLETHVRTMWERTRDLVSRGQIKLTIRNNVVSNNLPAKTENPVSHVRPHGANRLAVNSLPEGTTLMVESDGSFYWPFKDKFTTQCFWLNNDYILSQLNPKFRQ